VPPPTIAPPAAAASAFPQRTFTSGSDPTAPGEFVHNDAAASFDEDDAMNMPAPSVEYLAHVPHPASHPKRPASGQPSGLRNTLIPVLLTTAVLMLAAAVLKFVVHPDAPLAAMPTWLALILAAGALAFAGVAVVYVTQASRADTAAGTAGGPGGTTT
jgi:hypothetical protein